MSNNFTEQFYAPITITENSKIDELINLFRINNDAKNSHSFKEMRGFFKNTIAPEKGQKLEDYLTNFEKNILEQSSFLGYPKYLGHMTAPLPTFIPEIAKLFVTLNQNLMKTESSRGLTFLENEVIGMMHREIFQFDDDFYRQQLFNDQHILGLFTSGGTLANVTAMWIALNQKIKQGYNRNNSKAVIIGSELMHYSFEKSAELLNLNLDKITINAINQIDLDIMEQKIIHYQKQNITVIALVAIAGTTDFGSIDQLETICDLGEKYHIHVHIDAAWGGGLVLSKFGKKLLKGTSKADTVTIDGHKQLLLPIGNGMLFFKNPEISNVLKHHAPYAVRPTSLDLGRFTLEGTRPANALYLHAALSILGKEGYSELFKNSLNNASFMESQIKESPYFELMSPRVMNIISYRYIPKNLANQRNFSIQDNQLINDINIKLQKIQRSRGISFVSRTSRKLFHYPDQELILLRAVLLNPLTNSHYILELLEEQIAIGEEITR